MKKEDVREFFNENGLSHEEYQDFRESTSSENLSDIENLYIHSLNEDVTEIKNFYESQKEEVVKIYDLEKCTVVGTYDA